MRGLFLIPLFFLVACKTPQGDVIRTVEYTCESAATALDVINRFRAKISAVTDAQIVRARLVLDPICTQPNVPTLDSSAAAAMAGALAILTSASREAIQ